MKLRFAALAALLAAPLVCAGCLQGRGPAREAGNRADRLKANAIVQAEAGKNYLAADQPNDAFVCFTRAAAAEAKDYDAQLGLAQACARLGATTAGLNAATAAQAVKPNDAAPLLVAGQLSLAAQRPAEAEKYFRDAVRLDPKLADAWRDLGEAKFDQKALNESIAALERARDLKPEDAEIRAHLGVVYAAANQMGRAIAEYRVACRLDQKKAAYPLNLAWLLIDRNESLDEARKLAQKADALDRGDGDALVASALAFLKQGNAEDAVNELRQDLAKVDSNGDLWIYFAGACAERGKPGDYDTAYRALQTVDALQLPHRRVSPEQLKRLLERIKAGFEQERARLQGR